MASRKHTGSGGDEHLEVLRAIWNEMKALNARVDKTNERLDATNERLDAVRTELSQGLDAVRAELKEETDWLRHRVVESEVRLATATTQLSGDVKDLSGLIREWREEHRSDRADLRGRVSRLEAHVGIPSPLGWLMGVQPIPE